MTKPKVWDRPICPHCKRQCSIAGTPRIGSGLNYWKCFDCDYTVEEIEFEEIKTENEQTKISMATPEP